MGGHFGGGAGGLFSRHWQLPFRVLSRLPGSWGDLGGTLASLGGFWELRSPKREPMGAPRLPKCLKNGAKMEPKGATFVDFLG